MLTPELPLKFLLPCRTMLCMKTRIGITAFPVRRDADRYSTLNENYTRSVRAAEGLPFLLPFDYSPAEAEACLDSLDGLLLSGGGDLLPAFYNEEPLRTVNRVCALHDRSELALLAAAARRRLPVFGICRGCQVINVGLGGSLIQDIPSQLPQSQGHSPEGLHMSEPYHSVDICDKQSILAAVFESDRVRTNSFHHQAVQRLADGLRVTGRTDDGIIEAFEGCDPAWYVHGVQFHPEAHTRDYPAFLGLFSHFVQAATAYAAAGRRPA